MVKNLEDADAFRARLREEDRFSEFQAAWSEVKAMAPRNKWKQEYIKLMQSSEWAPLKVKPGAKPQTPAPRPPKGPPPKKSSGKTPGAVPTSLDPDEFMGKTCSLAEAYQWVLDHLYVKKVKPRDAPSLSAASIFIWAKTNTDNAHQFVTSMLQKHRPQVDEDRGHSGDPEGLGGLIDSLLAESQDESHEHRIGNGTGGEDGSADRVPTPADEANLHPAAPARGNGDLRKDDRARDPVGERSGCVEEQSSRIQVPDAREGQAGFVAPSEVPTW